MQMRTRVAKMIPKIIPSSTPNSQRLPPAFQAPSCQESKRRGLGSGWVNPRPGLRAERTRKSSPYRSRAVGRDVQAKAVLKIGAEWPPTTRATAWTAHLPTQALGNCRCDGNPPGFQKRARRPYVCRELRGAAKDIPSRIRRYFFFALSILLSDPFYYLIGMIWSQIKGREEQQRTNWFLQSLSALQRDNFS